MEHKLSTRAMTEGALMVGLAVIFALLGMAPVIGAFAILIFKHIKLQYYN